MKPRHHVVALRSALTVAIVAAVSPNIHARHLNRGENAFVTGSSAAPEPLNLDPQAYLKLTDGAQANKVSVWSATFAAEDSHVSSQDWTGVNAYDDTRVRLLRSTVWSGTGAALALNRVGGTLGDSGSPLVSAVDSTLRGSHSGAVVTGGGALYLLSSGVIAEGIDGVGIMINSGSVDASQGSIIEGAAGGVVMNDAWTGDSLLTLSRSSVVAASGPAVSVQGGHRPKGVSTVVVRDGSALIGRGGEAIQVVRGGNLTATIEASDVVGNVAVDDESTASVRLVRRGTLKGSVNGGVDIDIGAGSVWTATNASSIRNLSLDGGGLRFATARPGGRVHVRHDLTGSGGEVYMRTQSHAAGVAADRLLIEGDVLTTGVVQLDVDVAGSLAPSDVNGNGSVDATEGYSLVQVGGASRADAFRLKSGYVTVGPYQYGLYAFGDGRADEHESELSSGKLGWDYRLATRTVCDDECEEPAPPDPEEDGTGDQGGGGEEGGGQEGSEQEGGGTQPSPAGRVAVAPQIPSYLTAPAAFLTYERSLGSGLSERLGDIRRGSATGPVGVEMFARYIGGQARYSSNLSFKRYGYAFDQRIDALQLGGGIVALDGDNGSLRAGWAWDQGSTTVSPRAVDGDSMTRYRAYGVNAWVAWANGDGPWADAWVGSRRYRGSVDTALRGKTAAKVRANARTVSVEAGWPFSAGGAWAVEPRMQVARTWLNTRTNVDKDGLVGNVSPFGQTEVTLGARMSREAFSVLRPYVGVEVTGTRGGSARMTIGNDAASGRFSAGRLGNAYRLVSGVTGQVTDSVQLYAHADYRHGLGGYGSRMWFWQAGVRVNF